MQTVEVERSQWRQYFESFSEQHQGESAVLREIGPDIGDQIQASDRAFVGIAADDKDGETPTLTVMLGQEFSDNIEHIVTGPSHVYVRDDPSGQTPCAVEIQRADGPKTILELRPRLALT